MNLASCPAILNLFTVLDSIFNFVIYGKATGNTLFCVFSFIEITHLYDTVTPGRHYKQLIFSQTDNRNKKVPHTSLGRAMPVTEQTNLTVWP